MLTSEEDHTNVPVRVGKTFLTYFILCVGSEFAFTALEDHVKSMRRHCYKLALD